jgi:AcrR family transcriptional regulator
MSEHTAQAGPGQAGSADPDARERAPRRLRADAQRNIDSLLEAAKAVFDTSGVDAPAKEIADLAGVGVGTLYRHFPQRSDLVKAVFQREVDACADAAPALAAAHEPGPALAKWLHRYTEFLATKRGLAAALHSGDPAYGALPGYFVQRLEPALGSLLEAAAACGEIRADIRPGDLLHAVANLCLPVTGEGIAYNQRMVALLIDGLRYGADTSQARSRGLRQEPLRGQFQHLRATSVTVIGGHEVIADQQREREHGPGLDLGRVGAEGAEQRTQVVHPPVVDAAQAFGHGRVMPGPGADGEVDREKLVAERERAGPAQLGPGVTTPALDAFDHLVGSGPFPGVEDLPEEGGPVLEVPVEAAPADAERLGQRLDPDGVRATRG